MCLLHLPIRLHVCIPSIADITTMSRVDSTMDSSSDFTTDSITTSSTGYPTDTTSQCPHGRDPSTNCTQCFTGRDPSTDCVACLPGMYQPSDRAMECVTVPGKISAYLNDVATNSFLMCQMSTLCMELLEGSLVVCWCSS